MPQGSLIKTFQCAGYAFGNAQGARQTFEHPNPYEIALPAGKAGTLTTRTDNDTGVATLGAGHGIITSDVVDVYWSGGVRYGMDATVSGNAVTVDGGAGDNLPTQDDPVVVTKQVTFSCSIDGDAVQIFGVFLRSTDANAVGHLDLQDSGPATIAEFDLVEVDANANGMNNAYDFAGGDTNVLTGNPIILGAASNGSSTAAATLYVIAGENVI
jgi:hypothetical protein